MNKNYDVMIPGENKNHFFQVLACYQSGYSYPHPKNESQFLDPGAADEVDILKVFLVKDKRRRELSQIPEYLKDAIIADICLQEWSNKKYAI